jgi:hypothetical protein
MRVFAVTHATKGVSGFEEIVVDYRLNWFDKLIGRKVQRVFVNGSQGWLDDEHDYPNRRDRDLIIDALMAAGHLSPDYRQF